MKLVTILFLLLMAFCISFTHADERIPDSFVYASYATINTLDPCTAYDTTAYQRILNIYEPLIFFKDQHIDQFEPILAIQVPSIHNGGISEDGRTYMFTIRQGVSFHEGQILNPEDVVYSFKRNMITDPAGGPMWMLLEALTGYRSTRNEAGEIIPGIFDRINECIQSNDDQVIFKLPEPYPPFLTILAHSSAVILDKDWAISNGCWDGEIAHAAQYNNPSPGSEPLQKIMNGTGPYRLASWKVSREFIFDRFDFYWGEKPQIKTAIFKYVKEWSTRKLMLLNGDADRVAIDTPYIPEMILMKGLTFYSLPQVSITTAMFCQNINPNGNPNIGSGKLDGNGIPPDFFVDSDVRKGFLHSFNRKLFLEDVLQYHGVIPATPLIPELPFHKCTPVYPFDLQKAKAHFQKAWGGKLWANGFKMNIVYNTGNELRETASLMLAENIMSLNPKFVIEIRNIDWKDYIVTYRNFMFPIIIIGWGADFPDPHNFMYSFMHSDGIISHYLGYKNPTVNDLCEQGIRILDPIKRKNIYHQLQDLWYQEAIGVVIYQNMDFRAYNNRIQGFIPNPIFADDWDYLKKLWRK